MEERAWKAFCLLPLLLFRRPVHERNVSKEDLRRRFDLFTNGAWEILVDEAVATLPVPVKSRSEAPLSSEHRGEKAAQKVRLGEITRARQCLTGAPLAPGNDNTFNELQRKRPQEGRERVARARSCIHTGDTIGGEQGDPLEESQVIATRFISRTRWLHVRALEGVDGRCRHVQPVARGSDQPRSSEGCQPASPRR